MTPVRNLYWYVYALKSEKTGQWYIGSTKDLRKKILRHNSGKNKPAKYGYSWKLIYYEALLNREDVRAREKYLKSGTERCYFKNRLKFFFVYDF